MGLFVGVCDGLGVISGVLVGGVVCVWVTSYSFVRGSETFGWQATNRMKPSRHTGKRFFLMVQCLVAIKIKKEIRRFSGFSLKRKGRY